MSNVYEKINGVTNHFGRRTSDNSKPLTIPSSTGRERVLEIPFHYDNLPNYGTQAIDQFIPQYSQIVSADVYVDTAFLTGTNYQIGLYQPDGTLIDIDALFTSAELTPAIMTAKKWIQGSAGSGLGLVVANDACVKVTATGGFTAGKGKILVNYRLPELPAL